MRRALAFALALSIGSWAYRSSVVVLPTSEQVIAVVNLVPPLAGALLGHSLVEPMPAAARTAQRRLVPLFAARYAVLQLISLIIAVALLGATSYDLSPAVSAFVALSAVFVAILREWYWVPMLALTYAWLQLGQGDVPARLAAIGPWGAVAVALAGGGTYATVSPRWLRA